MHKSKHARQPGDLDRRYGEIGISAVAAALHYRSGMKSAAVQSGSRSSGRMRSKSQIAWETATKCAALAQEADDPEEREYYARLHGAWTTLAKRCDDFIIPDVTEK